MYVMTFILDIGLVQATLAEELPEPRAAFVGEHARYDNRMVIEFGVRE